MTLLNKVKVALRISHDVLDDDISETIETAKNEIVRAGVKPSKASDESDSLITIAIKTYCLGIYSASEKIREAYMESFKYQLDNLRKSGMYGGDDDE